MLLAVKLIVLPAHNGELLPAVGAVGVGLTVTAIVDTALPQPETLTNTLYVPDAAVVTPAIVGFCKVDENAFGPVQL